MSMAEVPILLTRHTPKIIHREEWAQNEEAGLRLADS
jgi:hypothetical protein